MRGLVVHLIIFLVPLLAAWATLEWWLARVPNSHTIKRENLTRLEEQIDTLILGASGSYWDIAPPYLSGNVYNLGNVAQTLYYDDQLATQLVPKLPKLKQVILTISYVSLFFQLQDSDEEERQYYYYQVWHIPPPRLQERLDPRMWSAVVLRTPGFAADSLRVAVTQALHGGAFAAAPVDPPIDARGWSPRLPGDPDDLAAPAVEKKLMYHHRLMHFSDEPANRPSLQHLIALLEQHHVELVLVVPPVWHEYAERMQPKYWHETESVMMELIRKHHLRYLSFLNTPELQASDFLDADHLNQQGAIRFTKILDHALQQPVN